jgi:hypothetical protein
MNDTQPPNDTETAAIAAAFGGRWNIWLSDTGHWWAARANPPTAAERTAGCVHFLRATTIGELRRSIEEQEHVAASPRQHSVPPSRQAAPTHPHRRTR